MEVLKRTGWLFFLLHAKLARRNGDRGSLTWKNGAILDRAIEYIALGLCLSLSLSTCSVVLTFGDLISSTLSVYVAVKDIIKLDSLFEFYVRCNWPSVASGNIYTERERGSVCKTKWE